MTTKEEKKFTIKIQELAQKKFINKEICDIYKEVDWSKEDDDVVVDCVACNFCPR